MVPAHELDEAVFRSVLPEDVDWKPFASFPSSVRLAVLVGNPAEHGPYVIRVKVPSGVKLMPVVVSPVVPLAVVLIGSRSVRTAAP